MVAAVRFMMPWAKAVRRIPSMACFGAARNSLVPGLAFFNATGTVLSNTVQAAAPPVRGPLRTISSANDANSSAWPRRLGKRMLAASDCCKGSGKA